MSVFTRSSFRTLPKVSPLISRASGSTTATSTVTEAVDANGDEAPSAESSKPSDTSADKPSPPAKPTPPAKTQLQLDEELRLKMSGLSGDGGESGVEYENGVPVSMKRSVKNNMFRYI